jgi:hypothetical protein
MFPQQASKIPQYIVIAVIVLFVWNNPAKAAQMVNHAVEVITPTNSEDPVNLHPSQLSASDLETAGLVGAECAYDPELHTGPRAVIETSEEKNAREAVAREVCRTCPVLAQCLARAVAVRPSRGVWGAFPGETLANLLAGQPSALSSCA